MDYEKALEIVRKRYAPDGVDDTLRIALETLIPELAESEDERIKEKILECVSLAGTLNDVEKARAYLEKQKEQKPAEWSEEDEEMLECVIIDVESAKKDYLKSTTEVVRQGAILTDKELAWLKSLPERFNLQPKQEWSEEDEKVIEAACALLCEYAGYYKEKDMEAKNLQLFKVSQRLKSLRPSWKPSKDEERLINTSISFLKDFADKGYENAVECIDWLKSKLNGNTGK